MSEAFQEAVPGVGAVGDEAPPDSTPTPPSTPGAPPASAADAIFGSDVPGPEVPSAPVSGTPEWAQELGTPENQAFIAQKGWDSPDKMLKSYQALEQQMGAPEHSLLRLKSTEDREAWHGPGGIFERLGRPEESGKYDLGEGVNVEDVRVKGFREVAFQTGLSNQQARDVAQWFAQSEEAAKQGNQQMQIAEQTAQLQQVRQKWGDQFEANVGVARAAMQAFGIDREMAAAIEGQIGTGEFLHKMHSLGVLMGGARHGDQNQAPEPLMSPEQATAEIERMKTMPDVWSRAMDVEGSDEQKKYRELLKVAYGE